MIRDADISFPSTVLILDSRILYDNNAVLPVIHVGRHITHTWKARAWPIISL
jgi:hypothetical protein